MSDKAKHTPGPWASHAEVAGVIYGPDGHQVCTTPRTTRRETERDANARLIAAAPELLEVLRAVAAAGGQDRHGFANAAALQDDDALSHRVRAAIGQATGQEVTP